MYMYMYIRIVIQSATSINGSWRSVVVSLTSCSLIFINRSDSSSPQMICSLPNITVEFNTGMRPKHSINLAQFG